MQQSNFAGGAHTHGGTERAGTTGGVYLKCILSVQAFIVSKHMVVDPGEWPELPAMGVSR